jgi:lysophospholipase L1-like esterase
MNTPPTIVAIGDSLTQGFQHGAIRRPEWSFPAMIARSFGHHIDPSVAGGYRVPDFGELGFPVDLERLLGDLEQQLGDSLERREWLIKLPKATRDHLDRIEDYYERGPGSQPLSFDGHYHNLAVWGFTVNEALTLTPAMCAARVAKREGWVQDDVFDVPSMPMHRAAMRVLNPAASPARAKATVLDNLRALAEVEPIDMLIVWLGSNDCLGTVLSLEIADMPPDYDGEDPLEREAFNLTSNAQFERDYTRLANEITAILSRASGRRQVYVGTVPYVTIPPLTHGTGTFEDKYFESYGWFFRDDDSGKSLSREQARLIDRRIDGFNASIHATANAHGWTIVDTAAMLEQLAVRRNGCSDQPGNRLRLYLESRGFHQHPLLSLDPLPCVSRYTVENGAGGHRRTRGGLFGLDHVHPSTLGYGLAAERFLEAMIANNPTDPVISKARIDWPTVIRHDTLEQYAPRLWDDLMAHAKSHPWLWEIVVCTLSRKVR